jgi:hypothetical protein
MDGIIITAFQMLRPNLDIARMPLPIVMKLGKNIIPHEAVSAPNLSHHRHVTNITASQIAETKP